MGGVEEVVGQVLGLGQQWGPAVLQGQPGLCLGRVELGQLGTGGKHT